MKPEEIREKLSIIAQKLKLKLPQVQLLLAQERFIARLAEAGYAKNFIIKGGTLVLRLYDVLHTGRFTVDVDLLLKSLDFQKVKTVFEKSCAIDLNDGFKFKNIRVTKFIRETPYGGERFEINWTLFNKMQSDRLRIDVCSGDTVDAQEIHYNDLAILKNMNCDLSVFVYPPHFIFAEKFETAYTFGTGNTRAKDYIDMWTLIHSGLDKEKTLSSIEKCFKRRNSVFKKEEWMRIIKDTYLQEIITTQIKKNYKDLNLPSVDIIFDAIDDFILLTIKKLERKIRS